LPPLEACLRRNSFTASGTLLIEHKDRRFQCEVQEQDMFQLTT
jgi:hypothetical protein